MFKPKLSEVKKDIPKDARGVPFEIGSLVVNACGGWRHRLQLGIVIGHTSETLRVKKIDLKNDLFAVYKRYVWNRRTRSTDVVEHDGWSNFKTRNCLVVEGLPDRPSE